VFDYPLPAKHIRRARGVVDTPLRCRMCRSTLWWS